MATIVITGANRGIGLELAKKYAARLNEVIACCRSPSPALEAVQGVRIVRDVDVTDDRVEGVLQSAIGDTAIDVLVLNAGVMLADGLDNLDFDGIRRQFEVNALGPLRVVAALSRNLVRPGGKIAIITSRMGSIADNTSGGMYGYRMSKAAVNMAGVSLAHDLAGEGVAVQLLHPGHVKTDMTQHNGKISPADSARGLLDRIDELGADSSGRFVHVSGDELPW